MEVKPAAKQLHSSLTLYVNDQFYSFQPPDNSSCLSLNRFTGDISLEASPSPSRAYPDRVFGILGLISLTTSDYIVLVVGRESHGHIFGHEVFRATDFKVLPLSASAVQQHPVESHLLALIHSHLFGGTFWFSYTWDLTRRLQAQRLTRDQDFGKPLWETADDRFFWNKFLHSRFIDITLNSPGINLSQFILPVMYGTFEICDTSIKSRPFRFGLISRRSRYRAGTRYFTRGIDQEGHVANFNESEQIIILEDKTGQETSALSFVQTRGSVPVFWAEINTLRYKPDLQIMELPNTDAALRLHLQEQVVTYGPQHIVNLVKQKGYEKPIKEAFERHITQANVPKVQYDYFDFHNECKNMQWHRIDVLINRMKDDLVEKGYFYDDSFSTMPKQIQGGVIRTNCMDNLDRTNVVQSALAKWTLTQQLREAGILQPTEDVEEFADFMIKFRQIWADHADSISRAYSGTGALKTDFTRTGKRTNKGLLQDGVNSIMRYLKNNYFDGARQDAFDVITGTWIPRKGPGLTQSLLFDNRTFIVRSMPYILSFSIFMVFAGLTLPRTSDYSLVYYFSIWIFLMVVSLTYIFIHGVQYVSWPRLNTPIEAIYYSGPGFRSGRKGLGNWTEKGGTNIGDAMKGARTSNKFEEIELGSIKKRVD